MGVELLTPPYELVKRPAEPQIGTFIRAPWHKPVDGPLEYATYARVAEGWINVDTALDEFPGWAQWARLCESVAKYDGVIEVVEPEPPRLLMPCCGQLLTRLQMRELVSMASKAEDDT